MLGAITGDIVGSVYEFHNIKTTNFPLFLKKSNYTDDTILTIAVADWLYKDVSHSKKELVESMLFFCMNEICPMGGYGERFYDWLTCPKVITEVGGGEKGNRITTLVEIREPYNSWGNGSAMRVSSVGWMFDSLEETERVAEISASVTHNHPEGIKGAQATAAAIFLARTHHAKKDIKDYVANRFGYDLSRSCDQIRPQYSFNESCQNTVPQALAAFLDSRDFEDCIRLGVSLGGDSDTLCAIAGSIAEAFYGPIPQNIQKEIINRLPDNFKEVIRTFSRKSHYSMPNGLE